MREVVLYVGRRRFRVVRRFFGVWEISTCRFWNGPKRPGVGGSVQLAGRGAGFFLMCMECMVLFGLPGFRAWWILMWLVGGAGISRFFVFR